MNMYKVILSTRQEIEIDEQDYEKIVENSDKGFVKVKRGIFNPSFLVAIVPILKEKQRQVEGHVDSVKKVFVVKKDTLVDTALKDSFPSTPVQYKN